ncbi:MAG: hypothetical protein IJE07_12650 [Clostridia bacterium]|nr:hypothetical protein [Clostridia bacterium]
MAKHHRGMWLLAAAVVLAGTCACLLTGRTLAHGLTIALAAGWFASIAHVADGCLPDQQSRKVRVASGAIFAAGSLALLGFYAWHFAAEETIFINDDSLYYYQQLALSEHLNTGLPATLQHFAASLSTDYTCLANLLLAPLFALTDRTADGFGLTVAIMTWLPLLYQLRRLTLRLADRLGLSGGQTLLLCAGTCVSVIALPILHRAALWRQVNLMGLPLLLQVIFLTRGIALHRTQPLRWGALLASCVLLALMRRWFLFFLAGWLPLWGISAVCSLLRRREYRHLARFAACACCCLALGTLLLWPLLSRAIAGNYAVSYAYWRKDSGALAYEMQNQGWLLGWGSCGLIAAGYAWGLLQKRSPALRGLCGMMLGSAAIGVLLFTRIQNMTYHQVAFLMPAFVLGLMLLFAMLATLPRRSLSAGLTALTCAALLLQWGASVTHEKPQQLSPLLSHVSLKPPVRQDMAAIRAVSDFISQTCTADDPALILMNSNDYDRLTFVTPAYPDLSLREKVALDRTALVSDGFPRMWFAARYILVPTIPQTNHPGGTVEKLTRYLLADEADRFDVVATFPMDGFDLLVMERRGPVQYDEYEELLALFADEHALYPAVYGDRMGFFYGLVAGYD